MKTYKIHSETVFCNHIKVLIGYECCTFIVVQGVCTFLPKCSSYCHDLVTFVEPYTPYEVTVTAKTSIGAGVSSSCVFFTEEGGEYDIVSGSITGDSVSYSVTCGEVYNPVPIWETCSAGSGQVAGL